MALIGLMCGCAVIEARAQIFTSAPTSLQRVAPARSSESNDAPATPSPRPARDVIAPVVDTLAEPPRKIADSPPAPSTAEAAPSAAAPATRVEVEPTLTPAAPRGVARPDEPTDVLRHLTNNIQGFRLTGEIGSSEWPFYVTDSQSKLRLRFQVGYLAAVSVMPEASFLTLVVNDVPVGRTNIIGTRGVRTAIFDLPPGLVKPGFNSVRLTAEQRHRVDCSLNATYELWTQIDPTLTGLILPRGDVGVGNIGELAGLPPDEEGALPIRAVMPARNSLESVERVVRGVQAISLAGRFAQPIVDVGPLADGEYGINLAIGTAAELSSALSGIALGAVNGPRLMIVPAGKGRRATVIATGRSDPEVAEALAQMAVAVEMKGSREGLRAAAAFPGFRIFGGQHVPLREFGLASEEFSGRLYRAAFNVIMPPDFYSADYAKANLSLDGGYAPGLDKGAQIVVSINDRNVVSLKLPKSSGDVFRQNPVPLPLGRMQPGLNRIEIEAQLPAEGDSTCDPISAISGMKRFLFLDSSQIEIPRIARIARMPDLAVTATGGFPYADGHKRPILYLPAPGREAVGAAATIAAHLAIAAGKVIDFKLTVTDPGAGAGSTLVIAPMSALSEDYLKSVGLDSKVLTRIWGDKIDNASGKGLEEEKLSKYEAMARHRLVLQKNFPAACHMPVPVGGFRGAEKSAILRIDPATVDVNPVAAIPDERATRDLYDQWNDNIRGESGVLAWARKKLMGISDFVRRPLTGARAWIDETIEGKYRKPAFTSQTSLVAAQDILGSSSDDVRTIIVAPNPTMLAQSIDCLVDPRVWRQVGGRIASLNASDGEITAVPSDGPRLIPTQPLSIENYRLIIAGWFSLNTKIYVELALCVALLLAWTTNRFVKSVGRQL